MRRWSAVLATTIALLAASCGDDPAISHRASRALNDQIDLVEFAIAAHEYEAARQGLRQVRSSAARFEDHGSISQRRALTILGAVNELDADLEAAVGGG
jgi:hypothetical protein